MVQIMAKRMAKFAQKKLCGWNFENPNPDQESSPPR